MGVVWRFCFALICASENTRPEVLSWVRALLFSQSAGPVICVSIFTGFFKREPVRMVDVSEMNLKKKITAELNIIWTR